MHVGIKTGVKFLIGATFRSSKREIKRLSLCADRILPVVFKDFPIKRRYLKRVHAIKNRPIPPLRARESIVLAIICIRDVHSIFALIYARVRKQFVVKLVVVETLS